MQVHGYYRKLQENWPCQSIPGHVYMLKTLLVHNIRQQIWQWNFSRVANIKTILWECNWADLKKCWFLCCYRPNPPKKNCHSEGIFFFSPKPWQALLAFHQKLYFQWYRQCCIDFHLKYSSFTTDSILDSVLSIVKEVLKYDQIQRKRKKKRANYLLILKLMCRSTANKELFRDGLDCFNWERERKLMQKVKKSIDDKNQAYPAFISLAPVFSNGKVVLLDPFLII